MASPLASERALPPEPSDAGNRVLTPNTAIGKAFRTSTTKSRPSPYTIDSSRRGIVREKAQSEAQDSTEPPSGVDIDMTEHVNVYASEELSTEEFPQITNENQISGDEIPNASEQNTAATSQRNAATLMDGIKGLLDLTNEYLRMLEEKHPGGGADFLALLTDGASRAMRGERIYIDSENKVQNQKQLRQETWADKAKIDNNGTIVYYVKRQNINSTPPIGKSKKDRRVMIRLAPEHC